MLHELLERYHEQGRGCGCPGDDFVDDQARYLLGLHRSLPPERQRELLGELEAVLGEPEALRPELRAAASIVGLALEVPAAGRLVAGLAPPERRELLERAAAVRELWQVAGHEAASGEQVAGLVRAALRREARSPLLDHCDPRALASAWDEDPSREVRTVLLHLLGDRSEDERRPVEPFLRRAASELLEALPGADGSRLWRRLTGWLRLGPESDALFLELLRCIAGVGSESWRRETLGRAARHPSPAVARRAATQLFLAAVHSASPQEYRPALEALAASADPEVRDGARYALTLERGLDG
jgi:hypothetical protein